MSKHANEKVPMTKYFMNLSFFLYFIILAAERLQSLIRSAADPEVRLFGDLFNIYIYSLAILSIVGSVVYLLIKQPYHIVGVFTRKASVYQHIDFEKLSVFAGIILFSGMVHTEYTIPPIQFGAYGVLIVGMAIQTALMQKKAVKKSLLWYSLIYITCFSMAIPVVYRLTAASSDTVRIAFHIIESVTSFVLVVMFTSALKRIFAGRAENLIFNIPVLIVLIGDAFTVWLRFEEEANYFLLIFAAITCLLWLIGKIWLLADKKNKA